jgi:uncharacterized protein YndB with AHSA1/START domain
MIAGTPGTVRVTRHFDASAERVFDAWLDPAKASTFFFATPTGRMVRAEIDARVGGAFHFVDRRGGEDVAHTGTYIEIDRARRLVFTFAVPKDSDATTRVTIDIVAAGQGCDLTLTHDGVPPETIRRNESGWATVLEGLASAVSQADEATCGKGLAAHAALPSAIGDLMNAMASVLDMHQQALDLTDERARPEHHAYVTLVMELRGLAAQLTAVGARMSGYHDLPMGRHLDAVLASSASMDAFAYLLQTERALLALLSRTAAEHEAMSETVTASDS